MNSPLLLHRRKAFRDDGLQALRDACICYYDMNESSGNEPDDHPDSSHTMLEQGTIGTVTSGGYGSGNARDFENGSTEWFRVADHADFSPTDLSAIILFNPDDMTPSSGNEVLLAHYDSGGGERSYNFGFKQDTDACRVFWGYNNGDSFNPHNHSATLSAGTWYLYIIEFDDSDDQIRQSVTAMTAGARSAFEDSAETNPLYNANADLTLGGPHGSGNFNGKIGEIGLFNTTWNDGDIWDDFFTHIKNGNTLF